MMKQYPGELYFQFLRQGHELAGSDHSPARGGPQHSGRHRLDLCTLFSNDFNIHSCSYYYFKPMYQSLAKYALQKPHLRASKINKLGTVAFCCKQYCSQKSCNFADQLRCGCVPTDGTNLNRAPSGRFLRAAFASSSNGSY